MNSDQQSALRIRLRWLLLLSILLQSVAPTVWAASAALDPDSKLQNTENGIWTISCAGKPMWLPISQLSEGKTGTKPGATDHNDNSRHCLICSNLTGTDSLPGGADYFDFNPSNQAIALSRYSVAQVVSQVRELYNPRAPPVLHE